MKKYLWSSFAAMMVVLLSAGFASCGGDDDDDPVPEPNPIPVSCSTTPTSVLTFVHGVVMNFQCDPNVQFFYCRAFLKSSMAVRTDAEIIQSVQGEGDLWERTAAADAEYPAAFTDMSPNTTWTVVTVSYKKDGSLGDVVKYDVTTQADVNQPEVNYDGADIEQDANGTYYYTVSARKGDNGYCSKYYVWLGAGTQMSSVLLNGYYTYWYLNKEISLNPSSHTTKINEKLDKVIYSWTSQNFTSDCREYLDGAKSQDTSVTKLRFSLDDRYLQMFFWGIYADGKLSGSVSGGYIDFEDDSAPRRFIPIKHTIDPSIESIKPQTYNKNSLF